MPLTGPASYLPTLIDFLAHWATADEALGAAGPLVVLEGVGQVEMQAVKAELEAVRALGSHVRHGREAARFQVEERRAKLLQRLNQFNLKLRSTRPGTKWVKVLPKAFTASEAMGRVLPPLEEVGFLWAMYETEVEPLKLMGGYTRTSYGAELKALKLAYAKLTEEELGLRMQRAMRMELEERIQPVLKAYRQRVTAEFKEGSVIAGTVPRLTPLPGRTPEPVKAKGMWSALQQEAELTWSLSGDDELDHYEIRAVPGPEYEKMDETLVAKVPAGLLTVWNGQFAMEAPGSVASFKVYVVLKTGNERGSNAVTVERPGPAGR